MRGDHEPFLPPLDFCPARSASCEPYPAKEAFRRVDLLGHLAGDRGSRALVFPHDEPVAAPVNDILNRRDLVAGKYGEEERVRAEFLVFGERQGDSLSTVSITALAHQVKRSVLNRRTLGQLFEPIVDLAKQRLVQADSPCALRVRVCHAASSSARWRGSRSFTIRPASPIFSTSA